jgi:hypothetical protein
MKDSFIFYRSYADALQGLPIEDKVNLLDAIIKKSLDDEDIELFGIQRNLFALIKPQIEANNRRYENGCKPKNKQSKSKTEANNNENINENSNNNHDNNEEYIMLPDIKYTNLTQEEFDTLKEIHGEHRVKKAIDVFDEWLQKGSNSAKQYIGQSHYAHFKPDCWVWEKAHAVDAFGRADFEPY